MAQGKKRSYLVLLLSVVSAILLPFACLMTDSLLTTIKTNKSLPKQSQLLWETNHKDYKKLKQKQIEIEILQIDKKEKERDIIRKDKVLVIYQFYRDSGMLYSRWEKDKQGKNVWIEGCWWITPKLLYDYIKFGEKYRPLIKDFNWDTLDGEDMYIVWACSGMNFKPHAKSEKPNKNGSYDYTMMDMNDINIPLLRDVDRLFPHLKDRSMYDMEKSIAWWHIWMSRQKYHSCWFIWKTLRKDAKELYFKLPKEKK